MVASGACAFQGEIVNSQVFKDSAQSISSVLLRTGKTIETTFDFGVRGNIIHLNTSYWHNPSEGCD